MQPAAERLGENFSVHMASSGTEALTTLGLTPIHIIVSAEDLPGMSGREALAEATKRSPDTKGILLASPHMTNQDRAALVNANHLQQVLNTHATPEQICDAVMEVAGFKDSAPLPPPANDHSAGPAPARMPDAARRTGQFSTVPGMSPESIPTLQPGGSLSGPMIESIAKVEVLVLTNDGSFLNTIRAAVGSSHVVNHAPNLQEAVDVVKDGRCGILMTDAAVATKEIETITAKLRKHLPSLVTIVAGRREDGEKMMGLISGGLVYRFLLKPISAGRARLAIEASAKKHLALANTEVPLSPEEVQKKMTETGIFNAGTFQSNMFRTTDIRETRVELDPFEADESPSIGTRLLGLAGRIPLRFALGAIACIALIAVLAAQFSGGVDEPVAGAEAGPDIAPVAAAEATEATPPDAARPAPQQSESSRLVAAAERAMQQNRIIDPAGDNALEYYASALAASPASRSIRRALDLTVERSLSVVENDLLRNDIAAAARHLATLNRIAPDHPRLPFLNRQTEQKAQSVLLSKARDAAANGDSAGALAVLDEAAALPGADPSAIAELRATIDAAGSGALTIPALLERAADRVTRGELVEPFNDSARYYYQAVLSRDPDNAVASQGLTFLAGLLLGNSRNALAANDIESAYRWLLEAEATGASPDVVAELRSRIAATQTLEAPAQPTEPPAAEPAGSTATDVAPGDTAPAQVADSPASAGSQVATPADDTAASAAPGQPAADTASSVTEAATDATGADPSAMAAEPDQAVAGLQSAAEAAAPEPESPATKTIAADSTPNEKPAAGEPALEQIRYVPPRYPRNAQRRQQEGWVDVTFMVQANGRTADVGVLDSSPADLFDRAAIEAVEAWRYAPLSQTDSSVTRRARVRLEFTLQE
jgi:protein TonB